jgi:glutamate dehydrogenase/leucine dehydrogenase
MDFPSKRLKAYLLPKKNNTLKSDQLIDFNEVNEKIWSINADVFLPCAASRIVQQTNVDQLVQSGIEVIASGANVPFADQEIFYGPIARYADENTVVIPDFVANCGMARVFAYLMSSVQLEISDEHIFNDVSNTIKYFMEQVIQKKYGTTLLLHEPLTN